MTLLNEKLRHLAMRAQHTVARLEQEEKMEWERAERAEQQAAYYTEQAEKARRKAINLQTNMLEQKELYEGYLMLAEQTGGA